jgi:hypothetical protein
VGGTLIHVDGERVCAAARLTWDPNASDLRTLLTVFSGFAAS